MQDQVTQGAAKRPAGAERPLDGSRRRLRLDAGRRPGLCPSNSSPDTGQTERPPIGLSPAGPRAGTVAQDSFIGLASLENVDGSEPSRHIAHRDTCAASRAAPRLRPARCRSSPSRRAGSRAARTAGGCRGPVRLPASAGVEPVGVHVAATYSPRERVSDRPRTCSCWADDRFGSRSTAGFPHAGSGIAPMAGRSAAWFSSG